MTNMDYTSFLQDATVRIDALGISDTDWVNAAINEAEILANMDVEPSVDIPVDNPYTPLMF
tara:strand:+ start:2610 stop:2792 length:183 start_codon:yes stop_codon:yes gene_type:complete